MSPRIISGTAGGRRLAVVPGRMTRPTSDRAREGLFATVEAIRGGLAGARVLDLYAGSGAVGLEALSRGAADVLLVEADARAARVIRENAATLGLAGAQVVNDRAVRLLARGRGDLAPRDFVFADPPYRVSDSELTKVLTALARDWLVPGAVVAIERATRSGPPNWPAEYEPDRSRRYGEATLWYGLAASGKLMASSPTGA
ncbi:MAG TPA: 16S rRNA (guanine(966)-N(2))-methyltransferase RsmD [Streptosporangiaceae bacterium]